MYGKGLTLHTRKYEHSKEQVPIHEWVETELFKETRPDCLVLLQPTYPMIDLDHVECCVAAVAIGGLMSAQTVVEVPHKYHHLNQRLLTVRDFDFNTVEFIYGSKRRFYPRKQDKTPAYALGGVVAVNPRDKGWGFFDSPSEAFPVDWTAGIDIETEDDLWLANKLLERRMKKCES